MLVNKKSIHFVLSKSKDADLLAWKNSLEDGSFNRTVNEILIAETEKKIATIPYYFHTYLMSDYKAKI